jgi:hypothetical protein
MSRTALYRHFDAGDRLLYVGISASPTRRHAEHGSRACWFADIARIGVEWFDNRADALDAERAAILSESPVHNRLSSRRERDDVEVVDLRSWMRSKGATQDEFSRRLNIGQSYLSRLLAGKNIPSLELAWAIECETDGAIPMQFWARAAGGAA